MNINPDSKYFFALPGTDNSCQSVFASFRKYSVLCGAEFLQYLRSRNLRKHFASLCTLQNLKENELDVVADFMGHDIRVHRSYYWLPQSTLQLVKMGTLISKKESGMILDNITSLNEVDIDEFVELEEELNSENDDDVQTEIATKSLITTEKSKRMTNSMKYNEKITEQKKKHIPNNDHDSDTDGEPVPRQCSKVQRRAWTKEENNVINHYFSGCIEAKIIPGKERIEEALASTPTLKNRTWRNIKDKVRNMFNR